MTILLDAKFKSFQLVQIFQQIYQFELNIHQDDISHCESCLCENIGDNELAKKFTSYVEFSYLTQLNLIFWDFVEKKSDERAKVLLLGIIPLMLQVMLYYLDMVKDIFFIVFIKRLVPDLQSGTILAHILAYLIAIFVVNEAVKWATVLYMKNNLKLSKKSLFITSAVFPLMPAILIYLSARMSYNYLVLTKDASTG